MSSPEPRVSPTDDFAADPRAWLLHAAGSCLDNGRCYLLAHTERGVVWGLATGTAQQATRLITSDEVFGPKAGVATLDPTLLWELRLFGPNAQVHLWRGDLGWAACRIDDGAGASPDIIVERQVLWGDKVIDRRGAFTLLEDGSEGKRHGIPLSIPDAAFTPRKAGSQEIAPRPARLVVRHYLEYDSYGNARIARSRLAGLEVS